MSSPTVSTVRDADLILVFDHGRIVERGTYGELLARGGHFASLVAASSAGRGRFLLEHGDPAATRAFERPARLCPPCLRPLIWAKLVAVTVPALQSLTNLHSVGDDATATGRLALVLMAAAILGAAAAGAANKSAKRVQPLDLEFRQSDVGAKAERRRPRLCATMRESPWDILADDVPVGGSGIPQFSNAVQADPTDGEGGLSLKGLLDGETITLLRIRLAPTADDSPRHGGQPRL